MSRAVVKTKKVGQINLGSMTKSNELTINITKLLVDLQNPANPADHIVSGKLSAFKWKKDDRKPDEIDEAFRQIRMLFDVGSEVDGYNVFYFAPAVREEKGYNIPFISLGKAPHGTASRMILVLGSREMLHITAAGAGVTGEGQMVIQKNWCHSLPLGFCSQSTIIFNNVDSEILPLRKGFRAGIRMKKEPFNRHVLVFDLITSNAVVAERIKREVAASRGEEPPKAADIEAAIAKGRLVSHGAAGSILDDDDEEDGTVIDVIE